MSYVFISEEEVRAAKRHRCIWCGESIPAGTVYTRVCGKNDGDFQADHFHPECRQAAIEYFRGDGADDDGFSPWENERPLSPAEAEYQSWDCALLVAPRAHERATWAIACGDLLHMHKAYARSASHPNYYVKAIKLTREAFRDTLADSKTRVDALAAQLGVTV